MGGSVSTQQLWPWAPAQVVRVTGPTAGCLRVQKGNRQLSTQTEELQQQHITPLGTHVAISSDVALLPVLCSSDLHQMLKGSQKRSGRLSDDALEFLLLGFAPSLMSA